MKAFVTGGTGFIGKHVVRKLVERKYNVYALVRSGESAAEMARMGATPVHGTITDMASMREGMRGSDVVFHIAGWYKVGSPDWMDAEALNVGGTRKVLRLAQELNVPKIVYTSSVVVFGDTKGKLADENYFQGGPFLTEYDRTKWLAHYKVALPMMEKGAPIIIVQPGVVYGPGDHSLIGQQMIAFYRGQMPVVFGPDTTVTYAHVEDIAEGHILAAEKGKIGESYVLAGPAVPLGEMFDFWAQITGKRPPALRIPTSLVKPFGPVIGAADALLPLPEMFSQEAVNELGATYMAAANKARAQLGWQPRSLHEGMTETFRWIAEETKDMPPVIGEQEKKIAAIALGTAVFLFLLYLVTRKRSGETD
jgi:nucleoside-diphosphate-sugar epimerase